jgi:hypothetical protein
MGANIEPLAQILRLGCHSHHWHNAAASFAERHQLDVSGPCCNNCQPRSSVNSPTISPQMPGAHNHWRDTARALQNRPRNVAVARRTVFMSLINLIVVLVVVGLLLWLVNRFIPMEARIKSILNVVVIIVVILWLLNVFGLFHSLSGVRIGR